LRRGRHLRCPCPVRRHLARSLLQLPHTAPHLSPRLLLSAQSEHPSPALPPSTEHALAATAILRPVQWLPPGTICGLGMGFDLLPPSFPNILFWACIYILLLTLKSPPHPSLPLLGVSVLSLSRQFREQIKSVCIHHHNSLMVDPASHNPFG
jgi:hypothetical protein